jgi:glycosyltransferase involved in cell wall biosynthesis
LLPISVIIPCYRCKDTITRAVESVAAQTKLPAELILVDDNSNDGTLDTLFSLKTKYSKFVTVISLKKNSGAAFARNTGWNASAQPYIALLDSDDAWHPDKLEIQYEFMIQNPHIDISGHSHLIIDSYDKGFNWPSIQKLEVFDVNKHKVLLSNPFITPSVMLKRNIKYRFNESSRYMEDHLLWLEILLNGYNCAKINLPLAAIFKPPYGASGLSSNLWLMEKAELFNYYKLHLSGNLKLVTYLLLSLYSVLKFIRRVVISYFRKYKI